jgi:SAM-dependent methyltransferase
MAHEKFEVADLERLNDEGRFKIMPPEVMWRALGDPNPKAIVDIGAGTGLFSCRFAELAPDAEVYAIDIEPSMVRWMVEHRPAHLCRRLHPLLGKEATVPLGTGEADLVVMMNLHHELADPDANYREALRLLDVGGQILVVDWAPGAQGEKPPQHIRASPELIAEALSVAGFESVTVHPDLPSHSMLTAIRP